MTIKNISIGVLYLSLLGLFGYNEISEAKYQDQQFQKINKYIDSFNLTTFYSKNYFDFDGYAREEKNIYLKIL